MVTGSKMKIKIVLKTKKIPIIYHHRLVSLIKEALKKSDPDYKENMYKESKSRPFTFSLSFPSIKETKEEEIKIDKNFSVIDKVFYFDGDINLFITSSDYEFIMHLYNGLLKLKKFKFSSDEDMVVGSELIEIDIKKVYLINDKKIKDTVVIFKTNSPILLEDEKDNPISFLDENINLHINKMTNLIFNSSLKRNLYQELVFKPLKMDKQVIKHTIKEFRERTGKPIMYLTGFRGIFQLSGHPEDLEFLHKTGFGSRSSQGFGMLEIVG